MSNTRRREVYLRDRPRLTPAQRRRIEHKRYRAAEIDAAAVGR